MKMTTDPKKRVMAKAIDFQIVSLAEIQNFRIATIYKCPSCGNEKMYNYFVSGHTNWDFYCNMCKTDDQAMGVKMKEEITHRVCTSVLKAYLKNFKSEQR